MRERATDLSLGLEVWITNRVCASVRRISVWGPRYGFLSGSAPGVNQIPWQVETSSIGTGSTSCSGGAHAGELQRLGEATACFCCAAGRMVGEGGSSGCSAASDDEWGCCCCCCWHLQCACGSTRGGSHLFSMSARVLRCLPNSSLPVSLSFSNTALYPSSDRGASTASPSPPNFFHLWVGSLM